MVYARGVDEALQRRVCDELPVTVSGVGVRATMQGRANHTWLFDEHVVRIAVGDEASVVDARTEAVAVPPAVAAGIVTPRLVAFVDRHGRTGAPVTVYERVRGRAIREAGAGTEVWRAVGRELARLHERVTEVPDPAGWLDVPSVPDLDWALGFAGTHRARLTAWASGLPEGEGRRVFLHGDAHAGNLMLHEGRFAGLIDWGDAGFGDVAWDFEPIPVAAQPVVVAAWRAATGWEDATLEGRVLRATLAFALCRIARPKPAMADPTAPLKALLRFLETDPGPKWTQWFPST